MRVSWKLPRLASGFQLKNAHVNSDIMWLILGLAQERDAFGH